MPNLNDFHDHQAVNEKIVAAIRGCSVHQVRAERLQSQQIIEHLCEQLRKRHPKQYKRVLAGDIHPLDLANELDFDHPPIKGVRSYKDGRSVKYRVKDIRDYMWRCRASFFQEAS